MGSDTAHVMANLFLFYYEYKWIRKTKCKDLIQVGKVSHMFRFIDDRTVINNVGQCEKVYYEIYPHELELKRENSSHSEAFFWILI